MRLSISRNAAFSAAFVAAVTRVFLNLALDGDAPHTGRGCDAQAWGLSEYYRVWKLLHPASKSIEKDHE